MASTRHSSLATLLRAISILFAPLLVTCALVTTLDANGILIPSQDPIPASYFDLNILFHPATQVAWPAVPFYGWRLAHANWPDLEPQKDRWNFSLLDKYVSWADQHHTEILMILTFTPRWASSSPDAPSDFPNSPGYAGIPRDMNDWRTFVQTVATRYKGHIHLYEIWNEPDRPRDWVGDTDTMISMVRDAAQILKQIDPSITVLSPCPTYPNGLKWLNGFLQKGGSQYVDVIAYHFYVAKGAPPENVIPLIQQVRGMMQKYGVGDKPLWNTEAGYLGDTFLPDDQQAAYVARFYILNWAAGIPRYYWYAWEDHHGTQIELVEKDNATLTPAGHAYDTIQQWLKGSVMKHCQTDNSHNWVCELDRDGSTRHIIWNADSDHPFRVPQVWNVHQVTTLAGQTSSPNADSIQIGIQPLLLH